MPTHAPIPRRPARPLRDPRAPRRGRDGRGLPRARHAARPRRRDQGPAARDLAATPDRLRASSRRRGPPARSTIPNILAIYDVGTHEGAPYVVSELLEGETLRERLRGGRAAVAQGGRLRACRSRSGLAAAHEKGIVHRDLKPENIFVTPRRPREDPRLRPRQARRSRGRRRHASTRPTPTPPHRARRGHRHGRLHVAGAGARASRSITRSDIFSFGADALRDALRPPRLPGRLAGRDDERDPEGGPAGARRDASRASPPALERIVRRCLEKNPEERFQSARDLAFALRRARPHPVSALPGRRRPHADPPALRRDRRPGSRRRGRLNAGWSGSAPGDRGRLGWDRSRSFPRESLRRSRAGILRRRHDRGADVEPGPDTILESHRQRTSAAQYKDRRSRSARSRASSESTRSWKARLRARAIRAHGAAHPGGKRDPAWAKSFDRDLGDVLILQGEIAGAIAEQIEAELTTDERSRLAATRPSPRRPTRHTCWADTFSTREREGLNKAFDQFTGRSRSRTTTPHAYAGIANYYAILPFHSALSPAEVFPKARAAAEKSVELDASLPRPTRLSPIFARTTNGTGPAAEREFRRLSTSGRTSRTRTSPTAGSSRRPAAWRRRWRRSRRPRSWIPARSLKAKRRLLYYFQGRYDDALKELSRSAGRTRSCPWRTGVSASRTSRREWGGSAGLAQGGHPALEEPEHPGVAGPRAARSSGRTEGTRDPGDATERSRKSYVPSYYLALVYTGLGEKDHAFEWLEGPTRSVRPSSPISGSIRASLLALRPPLCGPRSPARIP